MLKEAPLVGCTSTALWSSLNVRTALTCLPLASGTSTRPKDVSWAKSVTAQRRMIRKTEIVVFTFLKVYRKANWLRRVRSRFAGADVKKPLPLKSSLHHQIPMALRESEAIVLRSYPLREADLLVTLFTRTEGKVRGVARSAKKSKRRFGGALEPLTYVRALYDVREGQELTRHAMH